MDAAAFAASSSGWLTNTILNQKAFVPNPLPPKFDLSLCFEQVDLATRALAELKGMSYKVDNPINLINPLQRREAISSSSIEGTYTTASDLLILDADPTTHADPDTREVHNYIKALSEGLRLLDQIPVSGRLIKRVHEVLLTGVKRSRGAEITPGQYKRHQNFIGNVARDIADARFVPPPPGMTDDLMFQLEKYINDVVSEQSSPIIANALVHYQFETIHPFPDGNGRVGRLLLPLVLKAHNHMPLPLLYISPYIERHKDEYNNSMLAVSRDGAWEAWICFFARAMAESSRETIEKINKIAELKSHYIEKVQQARASALLVSLVDLIFDKIVLTIPQAAAKVGVTYPSARNNVEKLEDIGLLSRVKGIDRPKLYIANPLFNLIFDREPRSLEVDADA